MAYRTRVGGGGSDQAGARAGGAPTPAPAFFFLRTKLLPPRPVPALLTRPRLFERLRANLSRPVTLVAAPAGSGKTTLVADFVRSEDRSFVWYQLDRTDADPAVFLGYVTHGIRQAVPGFGDVTLSYLQQSAEQVARQPERAVDVLLNEVLERVSQRLILVLDDYHHLAREAAAHAALDRLISYLPDFMHVVIISRDLPPLAVSRLRSQSALSVIGREELLFTDGETRELFRQVFDLELTPEQLHEYRERTQGWITALQLVRQVAQREAYETAEAGAGGAARPYAPDLLRVLRQSEGDIFNYFAEEVFAGEPEEVRRLLLCLSLPDRVDLGACSHLYPETSCHTVLPELVRRNVFVTVASDPRGEEYRLHPLFQGFLRRRFTHDAGQDAVAGEHLRHAAYYLERGMWEHAVRHLLAAEDFERAAALIAERGGQWVAAGALASLVSSVEAIPPQFVEAHPRALFHRAEAARLRDELDTARSLYRRAAALLRTQNDREGEAEALRSLATIARRYGDLDTALEYLDRAVELTDEQSHVRAKCAGTRGLCLLTKGDLAAAEHEFRSALQSAEERGDEHYARLMTHNLGLPALYRGDFSGALHWMQRTLEFDEGAPPLPQDATVHLNMARCHLYRGEIERCESHLNRALEFSQLFNLTVLLGEVFETYGNLHRERGDAARARESYDRAARFYRSAGIDLARRELLEEQALLHWQEGDLAAARETIDRLAEARADFSDEMARQTAALARGRILLAQGEHEAARSELAPALRYFRERKLFYYEAQASMALASCAAALRREGESLDHLARALDLAARYDYEYWLERELQRDPRPVATEHAGRLLPRALRQKLSATLSAPPTPAQSPAQQPATSALPAVDLTINMLGPVEIYRDPARPFAPDAWTSKRARELLCFIASHPNRRVPKDVIVDTFWPDEEFESFEKKLHPTISYIRKALNSNQLLRQKFLVFKNGEYALNPEFTYRIDVEEFDRLAAEAEAARRAGEAERYQLACDEAVAVYRGEFMRGTHAHWAEERRAYYRDRYLRMLGQLAASAEGAAEWERTLALAQKILREDPFREDAHCMVMRAHAAQGNRVAVKGQYEKLCRLLRRELGVEPAQATLKVYRGLVG